MKGEVLSLPSAGTDGLGPVEGQAVAVDSAEPRVTSRGSVGRPCTGVPHVSRTPDLTVWDTLNTGTGAMSVAT